MTIKRHNNILLLAILFGTITSGCTGGDGAANEYEAKVDMDTVTEDLRTLSEARILLGHQSVGRNILAGLESLSVEAGVPLRIVEVTGAPPDDEPGIFHSNIGENGDPDSKCEVFGRLLTAYDEPEYDLAMMKFCYADLGRDTPLEVAAMIDRYARLVDEVRKKRPDIGFVHITMPLRRDPLGKKTFVKRLVGMSTSTDADNMLRNAFNDALRGRFGHEPMFDLAAVESTLPDGTRSSFENDGISFYTLAPAYAADGGHLNELARRRAAIAFVDTLVSTLQESPERVTSAQAPL